MSHRSAGNLIRLRGVRHNNLKNFDLDLPAGRLIVVTGLSGSGKSSLAFDTLYAEGQRRYIETFSPYARQFLDRMDKPQVDSIQGIPPAIAIEQRNAVKSTRSTVGTMTELCDYMKVVWGHLAQLHCRQCGRPVQKHPPQVIWQELNSAADRPAERVREFLITFNLPLSEKLSPDETLALIGKQGYQRILLANGAGPGQPTVARLEEARARWDSAGFDKVITVVQDRVKVSPEQRSRAIEAFEQAYHFGKGKLELHTLNGSPVRRYASGLHCAECDLDYREPSPALFSFNHPVGACPTCRGFGRTITIDYQLALPDTSRTLAQGAVKPWQTGQSAECQQDLMQFCRKRGVPTDVPFAQLSPEWQRWVLEGDPQYGQDSEHEWPRAWYGIKGYFRWLESRAYKMHVRVLLSRYRSYQTCPSCQGHRLQPEALLFRFKAAGDRLMTLSEFYQLSVSDALSVLEPLTKKRGPGKKPDPLTLALTEVRARLTYLKEVGLGYLTLDRPTRSLSGGETERVNLTTCLGTRLVNTLFVLDEPTVGLHARDTQRLIGILERLRDAGNTVVVVEHDPSVMRAADQLVDLGPGHGESGGSVVFQGSFSQILKSKASLTGQYLTGTHTVGTGNARPVSLAEVTESSPPSGPSPLLTIHHASCHNLKDLSLTLPLERFVCITGVSGSGKSTLVREVLWPLLRARLGSSDAAPADVEDGEESEIEADRGAASCQNVPSVTGWQTLGRVVFVDQSSLGKTPRSNPAVYIGAFEDIRQLFALSDAARQHGLNASAFSFNSAQGQCELCKGAGFEKIEMQFLSDVYVRCPSCDGRRYRQHILDVKIGGPGDRGISARVKSTRLLSSGEPAPTPAGGPPASIADLLDSTVDEGIKFLAGFNDLVPAVRAIAQLRLLQDVGLGYLRLGQPINTLSGGESQRLKLVSHLAEFAALQDKDKKPTLFLFDEPTTGLHFADVRVLLQVFQRLVDDQHSVVVIEHNLELIKCADWIVELGPEAGAAGGQVVAQGPPDLVAQCAQSATGACLR